MLKRISLALLGAALLLSTTAAADESTWPNGPDEDPRLAYPNDPGFIKINEKGEVTGGQWNLWSFVPESWQKTKDFREDEIALGTGIHADRAWQRTIGDRRVIIAVLDSGIKWDNGDLQMKHYLNKAELGNCKPTQTDPPAADDWDIDGNGYFNIGDYMFADDSYAATADDQGNQNGLLDPGDLIAMCSDGVDDDKNGYMDDISGWDAMWHDNDPYDDTRYGHGTGESRDSGAAGNDGKGDIGVCPECTIMNVRAGDSFVVDVNDFAQAVIFATDTGASVIQEALGSINNTPYSVQAIEYAHANNVGIIASAADELSFHHNMPGTNNHTIYVHAIVHDKSDAKKSTTFLNFNNCTNYGGQLLLSTPGGGCSSEATGITSGHAGLVYSAALKANIDPPLSAEELRGALIQSVDDIIVPEGATDITKFPSGPGWDLHFGYGRNNARTSVDLVMDDRIPPEADIAGPGWFEPIDVLKRPKIEITGRVGARVDGKDARYDNYSWELEWSLGVDPKDGWESIAKGDGEIGGGLEPAVITEWDVATASDRVDWTLPLTEAHQHAATLRLKVTSQHGGKELYNEFRKTVHFIKDDTLLPGYPKYMGSSVEPSPKVFDVDGDGKEEAVWATTDGLIHALKADGSEAAGFPAEVGLRQEVQPDGAHIRGACAFQTDKPDHCTTQGSVDPDSARQTIMSGIAVGALTGDKADLSIVAATFDGYIWVFDTSGALRDGWPQRTDPAFSAVTNENWTLDEGFFSVPVLYDLDGDGDLEIVAAAMDMHVYVWHHDGSEMDGWPVLVNDPIETQRARIIVTPAIGDADNDGLPEIAVGTNEAFGAGGAEQEARGYLLKHTGSPDPSDVLPALEEGWPINIFGLIVNTLPMVGRGVPSNPAMADLDGDGDLEIHMDAIAFAPYMWNHDGSEWRVMDNIEFGKKSPSEDAPSYTLINNGSFAKFDDDDTIDFIKGTAGFDFALTFAEGGIRAVFDHQLSAWDTSTGDYLKHWPRIMDDWQFFMNPTVVDIDGDGLNNVLNGSGGYLLHAFDHLGNEPAGFPKNLGSWIIASPTFGDLTGDGNWDVVNGTRSGWVFAWKATGKATQDVEWQTFAHDFHNTNNYEEPTTQYNDYPESADDGGTETGTETGDATTGADAGGTGEVTPPVDDDDGCTAGAVGHPGSAWVVLLMLLGLVAVRRRLGFGLAQ